MQTSFNIIDTLVPFFFFGGGRLLLLAAVLAVVVALVGYVLIRFFSWVTRPW